MACACPWEFLTVRALRFECDFPRDPTGYARVEASMSCERGPCRPPAGCTTQLRAAAGARRGCYGHHPTCEVIPRARFAGMYGPVGDWEFDLLTSDGEYLARLRKGTNITCPEKCQKCPRLQIG